MLYFFWKIKYKRIFEKAIIFVDKSVNNLLNNLLFRIIIYLIL
jgi:hypothetical protein